MGRTVWLPPAAGRPSLALARYACCTGLGALLVPASTVATLRLSRSCVVWDTEALALPKAAGGGTGVCGVTGGRAAPAAAMLNSSAMQSTSCSAMLTCSSASEASLVVLHTAAGPSSLRLGRWLACMRARSSEGSAML